MNCGKKAVVEVWVVWALLYSQMGSCEEFIGCGKHHVLTRKIYVLWDFNQPIFKKGLEVHAVYAPIGEIFDDFYRISSLVGERSIQQSIVLAFDCWP
tara:strand:- start:315 stop:605 length:291 start_codon:yes stop_codon:yes gene_type:complete